MFENLSTSLEQAGVFQHGFIDTEQLQFSDEVRKMCESNICQMYNKTWACPPAIGTVEECKERCLKYKKMLLFSVKYDLEDSFDFEGMTEGMNDFKRVARRIAQLVEPHLTEYLILANEGCNICELCSFPHDPCRFPDMVHGSLEGYGLFVNELAKAAGINYINGANTVTYFGAILIK